MTLTFYCLFILVFFFSFSKIKFHEPKGIFVLGAFFYIVFGMSNTLPVIAGDIDIPNELRIAIVIAFTPLLLLRKKSYTNNKKKKFRISNFSIKMIRNLALIIGYLGFVYTLKKLGGFNAFSVNPNRVLRNQLITESGGNFPYSLFLYIGFTSSLLYEFYKGSDVKKIFLRSFIFLSPLLLYNLFEGERSNILKFLFIAFFFYTIKIKHQKFKLNTIKLVLISIGFIIFSIIGNVRSYLNLAMANRDSTILTSAISDRGFFELIVPNEPKAVAFTWRYTHRLLDNGKLDYKYGYTYFQGLTYFFPTTIFTILDLKKDKTISDKIGEMYAYEYGINKRVGFGYLGISELYLNFGLISCLFFFPIFFTLISVIENQVYRNKTLFEIVAVTFLPYITFFTHRVSFASVLSGYIWFLVIVFGLFFISKILKST